MKCGELRCRLCGRNAMESRGWLKRVGEKGDPKALFECRPACEGTGALSSGQKLLGAIEGDDATPAKDLN